MIPKDTEAYMIQAAMEIAKEKDFIPENEEALSLWMTENRFEICERAKKLQWYLLNKLNKPGVMKLAGTALAERVWLRAKVE